MNTHWSHPVSPQEAACRASGRRHYNAIRQVHAAARRKRLVKLLASGHYGHLFDRGIQVRLARVLGVHPTTICKDIKAILRARDRLCLLCGHRLEE